MQIALQTLVPPGPVSLPASSLCAFSASFRRPNRMRAPPAGQIEAALSRVCKYLPLCQEHLSSSSVWGRLLTLPTEAEKAVSTAGEVWAMTLTSCCPRPTIAPICKAGIITGRLTGLLGGSHESLHGKHLKQCRHSEILIITLTTHHLENIREIILNEISQT